MRIEIWVPSFFYKLPFRSLFDRQINKLKQIIIKLTHITANFFRYDFESVNITIYFIELYLLFQLPVRNIF